MIPRILLVLGILLFLWGMVDCPPWFSRMAMGYLIIKTTGEWMDKRSTWRGQ